MTLLRIPFADELFISTHTPLAGRDLRSFAARYDLTISTHTPLAGRDQNTGGDHPAADDFYSHAPRGA